MFRSRYRSLLVPGGGALLALLLGLTGLSAQIRDSGRAVLSPLSTPLQDVGTGFADATSGIRELGDLQRQNRSLRERAEAQAAEIARLRDLEAENRDLRSELGLPLFHEFLLVSAEVIGRPSTGETLTLNRGARDGLASGMAVVKSGNLIGELGRVGRETAELRLLADPRTRVPATVVEDRLQGLVVADRAGLKLRYIATDQPIRRGSHVTSSGLGATFPQGLLIGEVLKIERAQDGLFQEVTLKPALDTVALRGVFIMTGRRP